MNEKEHFVLKGKSRDIVFQRPFLNEEKKVVFWYSDTFSNFPHAQFVVDEKEKTIEILSPFHSSKIKIPLTEEHTLFLEKVYQWKQKVLKDLLAYAENLKSDKEVIWAWKTNREYCPYFFTTPTIVQKGHLSCKYISAFNYVIVRKAEEMNKSCFSDIYDSMKKNHESMEKNYEAIQKKMAEAFSLAPKEEYKTIQLNDQKIYELSLSEIMDLFV